MEIRTKGTLELKAENWRERIMELRSALFFTESSSMVKLPTHVIDDVEIDAEGNIWFAIARPVQHLEAFDREIPAKLDFYRKGKDFYMKVRGTASLVDHPQRGAGRGLSDKMWKQLSEDSMIGVKVKVEH